jgi:hypothetical protein
MWTQKQIALWTGLEDYQVQYFTERIVKPAVEVEGRGRVHRFDLKNLFQFSLCAALLGYGIPQGKVKSIFESLWNLQTTGLPLFKDFPPDWQNFFDPRYVGSTRPILKITPKIKKIKSPEEKALDKKKSPEEKALKKKIPGEDFKVEIFDHRTPEAILNDLATDKVLLLIDLNALFSEVINRIKL